MDRGRLSRGESLFTATDAAGTARRARRVIVCTGSRIPYSPTGVSGIERAENNSSFATFLDGELKTIEKPDDGRLRVDPDFSPCDGDTFSKTVRDGRFPVLRPDRGGEFTDTRHVPEDRENEWDEESGLKPAREALLRMLDLVGRS
ncbi:hypothetical protein ACIPUC_33300 [Streptomyces sp. LARHCF249]